MIASCNEAVSREKSLPHPPRAFAMLWKMLQRLKQNESQRLKSPSCDKQIGGGLTVFRAVDWHCRQQLAPQS